MVKMKRIEEKMAEREISDSNRKEDKVQPIYLRC
jgi:hypothetical protein